VSKAHRQAAKAKTDISVFVITIIVGHDAITVAIIVGGRALWVIVCAIAHHGSRMGEPGTGTTDICTRCGGLEVQHITVVVSVYIAKLCGVAVLVNPIARGFNRTRINARGGIVTVASGRIRQGQASTAAQSVWTWREGWRVRGKPVFVFIDKAQFDAIAVLVDLISSRIEGSGIDGVVSVIAVVIIVGKAFAGVIAMV
jgi:hypothetical protein